MNANIYFIIISVIRFDIIRSKSRDVEVQLDCMTQDHLKINVNIVCRNNNNKSLETSSWVTSEVA